VTAVAEQDVNHLNGIGIQRLARRYTIRPAALGCAIKQQLERLYEKVPLRGSRIWGSQRPDYGMFACQRDNCVRLHHFWISCTLHREGREDRWRHCLLYYPWNAETRVVDDKLEVVPRDTDEYPTQAASDSYAASLGIVELGEEVKEGPASVEDSDGLKTAFSGWQHYTVSLLLWLRLFWGDFIRVLSFRSMK
jgi:hypothetical protein